MRGEMSGEMGREMSREKPGKKNVPGSPTPQLTSFKLVWCASLILVLAWAVLGIAALGVVLGAAGLIELTPGQYRMWQVGFLFVAAAYVILAILPKCDACSRRILVDTGFGKHAEAEDHGFSNFAQIAIAVLRGRAFRCMYCGQEYRGSS